MKNSEEALSSFMRAKELCPEDPNPRVNLNVVLLTLERFDEAIANLETFTQDFPDECVGWDLYSQALLRKGMRKQALEANNKYEECKGTKQ
jgi:predicted Zn-dependent protease